MAKRCNIHMKDTGTTEVRCRCPFCDTGRGRLTASINRDRDLFYCFRCGEGLNAVGLFAKVYGMDMRMAYGEFVDEAA